MISIMCRSLTYQLPLVYKQRNLWIETMIDLCTRNDDTWKKTSRWHVYYVIITMSTGAQVSYNMQACRKRGVGVGVGRGFSPQFLAKHLTLSQPGGTDYAHHSTMSPPGFSDLATGLYEQGNCVFFNYHELRSSFYFWPIT